MTATGGGPPIVAGWARINDGTHAFLPNFFASDADVHLALSNDLTTPVDVQAYGTWDAH